MKVRFKNPPIPFVRKRNLSPNYFSLTTHRTNHRQKNPPLNLIFALPKETEALRICPPDMYTITTVLDFFNPTELLITIPALLVAIVVHEFAHAWTADRLGDPTPRIQGRLTLNPKAHLDPIGTLAFLLFRFGWGKPVQFDPYNLQNPRRDAAIISFAGPGSNLLVAALAAIIFHLSLPLNQVHEVFDLIAIRLIQYNTVLAVFNLLPIHPLDGGKILAGLLPPETASEFDQFLNQYGFIILLMLILPIFPTGPLVWKILGPTITLILNLLLPSASII